MLSVKDFAEMSGLTTDQAQLIVRTKQLKDTKAGKIGRDIILDDDKIREYTETTLVEQIEDLKTRLARKEEAYKNLQEYLSDSKKNNDSIDQYMTTTEAAKLAGCSKPFLYKLIERGVVEGRTLTSTILVHKSSIPVIKKHIGEYWESRDRW